MQDWGIDICEFLLISLTRVGRRKVAMGDGKSYPWTWRSCFLPLKGVVFELRFGQE